MKNDPADSSSGKAGSKPRPRTVDAIRNELLAECSGGGADEVLLADLAASTAALVFAVESSTYALTGAMPSILHDSKRAVAVARTIQALVEIGTALVRRVESTLSTASALRTQRRISKAVGR